MKEVAAKRLPKARLSEFLDRLVQETVLVAPVENGGVPVFRPVQSSQEVVLKYVNTVSAPKEFLFPHTEDVFRFETGPEQVKVEEVLFDGAQVVFGLRPCDLASFLLLDKVFLTGDFEDAQYRARRDRTLLIGLACERVADSCFCTTYDLSPGSPAGADVMFYADENDDGSYQIEILTERADRLLPGMNDLLEEGEEQELQVVRQAYLDKPVPLSDGLDLEGVKEKLDQMWDHTYWARVSKKCHSCGICTFNCPTCHCFLMQDEKRGEYGIRFRCWDSCMFPDFVLAAGGHNPRPTQKERARQRFMHKLTYFVDRYGAYLCTGCGRCIEQCPVGLHIAGVISDVSNLEIADPKEAASHG